MAENEEKKLEKVPAGDTSVETKLGEFRGQTHKPTSEQVQALKKFTLGDDQNPLQIVKPGDDPRKQQDVVAQADRAKPATQTKDKTEPRDLVIKRELEKLMMPGHAYQMVFTKVGDSWKYEFGRNSQDQTDFQAFQKALENRLKQGDLAELIGQEIHAHKGRWVLNVYTQRPTQWKPDHRVSAEAPQTNPAQFKPQTGGVSSKQVDDLLAPNPNENATEPRPRPTDWKRDLKGKVEKDKVNLDATQSGYDKQDPSFLMGSGSLALSDGRNIPFAVSPLGNEPISYDAGKGVLITCRVVGQGAVSAVQGHLDIVGEQRYFVVTAYQDGGKIVRCSPGREFVRVPLMKCRRDGSLKY